MLSYQPVERCLLDRVLCNGLVKEVFLYQLKISWKNIMTILRIMKGYVAYYHYYLHHTSICLFTT